MTRVVVDKAFLLRGERQEPGSTVDVDPGIAAQLEIMGRAHREADSTPEKKAAVTAEVASQPKATMTTDTAGGLVSGGKKAKGT